MGIVPIWGFQMMAALGLAFAFKLNKPLVILASNISIPPMIPIILYLSHWMGKFWMGDQGTVLSYSQEITLQLLQDSMFQYVLGSFTLAILAGTCVGLLAFLSLKIKQALSPIKGTEE